MSAVDEYRASDLWNVTLPETTDEGTLYRPDIPVVRKSLADAAIAELERYLAAGREEWKLGCDRIAELEAEVRKWKARRMSAEQKLGYEEKLRSEAEAELADYKDRYEALTAEDEWVTEESYDELKAELAALKEQANTIDVRPNGRYLTNVHPVILNVVEDGYVEYLNLNLGEYKVKSWAEREKP